MEASNVRAMYDALVKVQRLFDGHIMFQPSKGGQCGSHRAAPKLRYWNARRTVVAVRCSLPEAHGMPDLSIAREGWRGTQALRVRMGAVALR